MCFLVLLFLIFACRRHHWYGYHPYSNYGYGANPYGGYNAYGYPYGSYSPYDPYWRARYYGYQGVYQPYGC